MPTVGQKLAPWVLTKKESELNAFYPFQLLLIFVLILWELIITDYQ